MEQRESAARQALRKTGEKVTVRTAVLALAAAPGAAAAFVIPAADERRSGG